MVPKTYKPCCCVKDSGSTFILLRIWLRLKKLVLWRFTSVGGVEMLLSYPFTTCFRGFNASSKAIFCKRHFLPPQTPWNWSVMFTFFPPLDHCLPVCLSACPATSPGRGMHLEPDCNGSWNMPKMPLTPALPSFPVDVGLLANPSSFPPTPLSPTLTHSIPVLYTALNTDLYPKRTCSPRKH